MSTFDPGVPDDKPDFERIAEALQGIRKELGLIRHSLETMAKTQLRTAPRRPNWPPEPPGVRSRR